MKKRKRILVLAAMMVGLSVSAVWASDAEVSVAAGVDMKSAYVWRGQTFNDGLVAQPYLDVTKGGLGLNVWANFDIDDYDGELESSEFSEVDLTASYGFSIGGLDAGVGYIEYLLPAGGDGTREIYFSLGASLTEAFSIAADLYYDVDEVEDFYFLLSGTYDYEIGDTAGFSFGASMAYAGDEYCADGDAGLYDYSLSASYNHSISDAWSLSLGVLYVNAFDEDKLADVEDDGLYDVSTVGTLNIEYAF